MKERDIIDLIVVIPQKRRNGGWKWWKNRGIERMDVEREGERNGLFGRTLTAASSCGLRNAGRVDLSVCVFAR